LLLVPAIGAWTWRERKRRAALKFPVAHVLARGTHRGLRARLLWLPPALQMAAVALGAVALARPQAPASVSQRNQTVEGIDIALALDLSASMDAADLVPRSRLEVAKQVLIDFVRSRVNDRVALVVFSGAAYTQAPLTLDYKVLEQVVAQLRTGVLEDGTAIGDAIGVALNRLRDSTAKSKALVLITDGDNNAGRLSPNDAAAMAKELRVPIFPILVGKGGRAPMPMRTPGGEVVYQEVEMPVNEGLLQELAQTTGGEFYRATDRATLKSGLARLLDKMERTKLQDGGATSAPEERFGGFLLGALALAALDVALRSSLLRVSP
jgi:Ca-activated chloride channel family protein